MECFNYGFIYFFLLNKELQVIDYNSKSALYLE